MTHGDPVRRPTFGNSDDAARRVLDSARLEYRRMLGAWASDLLRWRATGREQAAADPVVRIAA